MKKLMFVLAAVLAASMLQAAQFEWGAKLIMDGWDGGANKIDGTAYIFLDAGATAYSTVQGYISSKDVASIKSKAYDTESISGGVLDGLSGEDSTTSAPATFYFVVLNSDESQAYISQTLTVTTFETLGSTTVGWGSQKSATNVASGWSQVGGTTPDVPEPTSGLLLLVGAGMLALRRKQK